MAIRSNFYAHSRSIDPTTGDVDFDASVSGWADQHPTAWLIASVLCTDKGSALRNKDFGTDWTGVDVKRKNWRALADFAIRNALKKYVQRGMFSVEAVDLDQYGDAIVCRVSFKDPRDAGVRSVRYRRVG